MIFNMKKLIFIFLSFVFIHKNSWSQTPEDPVTYLANDDRFISWISTTAINQLEIYINFKAQLGDRLPEFQKNFQLIETDEQLSGFLDQSAYNPEFADDKIANYILEGMMLKQKNEWLWQLEAEKSLEIIHQAYLKGLRSNDPRWINLINKFNSIVITSQPPSKSIASTIASCLWETVREAFAVVGGMAALIAEVNDGNWNAALTQIKGILRKSGKKFGWFGLAWAALDIGICIWNNV